MAVERPWFETAFGPLYRRIYAHRDDAEARRYAPGIRALLGLPRNARVLDVGCGEGRYARALVAMGYRVTGVDLSASMLEAAAAASADLPGTPTYVRCDMRDLPFFEQFDGAVSLFTSFGYFDDRVEDLRQLSAVRRALVPGGRFVIDVGNARRLREELVASSEERRPPYLFRSRRAWDETSPHGPYVRKETDVIDERTGRLLRTIAERVRPYEPDALDAALVSCGFVPLGERRGDLDGSPFTTESPRLVRVCERPRARAVVPAESRAAEGPTSGGLPYPPTAGT
jgi:SAM-dependent methyltransferase